MCIAALPRLFFWMFWYWGTFCYITSFINFMLQTLFVRDCCVFPNIWIVQISDMFGMLECWITWIKSDEHQLFPIMLKLSSGGLRLPVAKLLPQKNCTLFTLMRGLEGHGYNWLMPRWPIWFKLVVNSTCPILIIYLFILASR